jgi:hypothetical protein
VEIEGDPAALSRFIDIFAWPVPEQTEAKDHRSERIRS